MLTDIGKEFCKPKGLSWGGDKTKDVKDNFETAAVQAMSLDVQVTYNRI
jgi:hypothetical protein